MHHAHRPPARPGRGVGRKEGGAMTGPLGTTAGTYTLAELAGLLGEDLPETARLLEEHGYPVPDGEERLPLTAEEYRELLVPAPLVADDAAE